LQTTFGEGIMTGMARESLVSVERVERVILILRGRRVILDSDLAALYGVTVSRFNEQVKRNAKRFPEDFAFILTKEEYEVLRSQFAILKPGRGGHRKYLPYVFTEHGAVMAASVLNSPRAIQMSVDVVRAFVRLRALVTSHHQLANKLGELEKKVASHDKNIVTLFDAVRRLMTAPEPPKRQIGFRTKGLPAAPGTQDHSAHRRHPRSRAERAG
jgi:ORF6N domain